MYILTHKSAIAIKINNIELLKNDSTVTNINSIIFLVNVNFGLKLQFIEKMFFFTTNASKNLQ
jgi:hypothetical protein